jgi:hypothetical protein
MRHGVASIRHCGYQTAERGARSDGWPAASLTRSLRAPLVLMLALSASGCSLWPWQSVPAAAVSNDQYVGMSCEELRNENDRLLAEAIDLRPRLAPGQGEEQRKKDVALISGEMDAVNRLRAGKKC